MNVKQCLIALVAFTVPAGAHAAANLVVNGSFESISTTSPTGNFQFSGSYNGGTVTGWSAAATAGHTNPFILLFQSKNAAPGSAQSPSNSANYATNQYNDSGNYLAASYTGASPDGGNFVVLDGDTSINGYLTQTVGGLTVGQSYQLTFYWAASQLANRTGATTEQIQVLFGNSTAATAVVSNPSQGFSGWMKETYYFTAQSASQALSFLSVGTPSGFPPIALLDGISLTAAPEPSALAMMAVGIGALVVVSRRRRVRSVAA